MLINRRIVGIDRRTLLAAALLLFCGSLWGAMPVLSKLAGGTQSHPIGLSLMVNAMGAVVCVTLCWWRGLWRWPTLTEWRFFFCWAFLYAVLNQVLIYWLAARIDAALVSVFTVLEGLVIFSAAALLKLEKPDLFRCGGLVVGLLGVMFLLFTVQQNETTMPSLLMAVGLLIPLSYAAESLFIAARRPKAIHPFLAVTLVMLCSLPFLSALAWLADDFMPLQFPPGRSEVMAFAIMIATVLANLAFFVLIGLAGSVFAGQISYFNAVAGISWGVLVLGEKLPWGIFVAFGFILLGLLMVRPKTATDRLSDDLSTKAWPAE